MIFIIYICKNFLNIKRYALKHCLFFAIAV